MVKVVIYPLRIKLNVLHRLRLSEQNHLLYNVHLVIGIDGLMEFSIIWKTHRTSGSEIYSFQRTVFFCSVFVPIK